MKKALYLITCLCLADPLVSLPVSAESWLEEGAREVEELCLQQLQTVQNEGKLVPFSTDGCSGNQSQVWQLLAEKLPH